MNTELDSLPATLPATHPATLPAPLPDGRRNPYFDLGPGDLGETIVTLFKLGLVLAILTVAPVLTAALSHATDTDQPSSAARPIVLCIEQTI